MNTHCHWNNGCWNPRVLICVLVCLCQIVKFKRRGDSWAENISLEAESMIHAPISGHSVASSQWLILTGTDQTSYRSWFAPTISWKWMNSNYFMKISCPPMNSYDWFIPSPGAPAPALAWAPGDAALRRSPHSCCRSEDFEWNYWWFLMMVIMNYLVRFIDNHYNYFGWNYWMELLMVIGGLSWCY